MNTESESCQEIERVIKAMLFAKERDIPPKPSFINENSMFLNASMIASGLNSYEKPNFGQPTDLIFPPHPDLSGTKSTLIDNEALMRFASEHLDEANASRESFTGLIASDNSFGETELSYLDSSPSNKLEKKKSNFNDVGHASNSPSPISLANKTEYDYKKKRPKTASKRKKRKVIEQQELPKYTESPKNRSFPKNLSDAEDDVYHVRVKGLEAYSLTLIPEKRWCLECSICNFTTVSDFSNFTHLSSAGHKKQFQKLAESDCLRYLPEPLPAQIEALTELISQVHEEFGMSEAQVMERKCVAEKVEELIMANIPGCSVDITGSSVSGCGLRSSAVDLILRGNASSSPEDLAAAHQLLLKRDEFKDVECMFQDKFPKITFTDVKYSLNCQLMIDPQNSLPLASLFGNYASLDVRVLPLTTAFKYFAQLCDLDQPENGTLPSFSFSLLLIYFLQRQDPPVLPALPEDQLYAKDMDSKTFKSNHKWCSKNTDSLGSLWLKLFKFYCLEYTPGNDVINVCSPKLVTCTDKNWGTKFLAIEEPYLKARNLARCIPNKAVFKYVMDCFEGAYRYFGFPRLDSGQINLKPIRGEIGDDIVSSTEFRERNHDSESPPNTMTMCENDELADDDDIDVLEDHDPDVSFDDYAASLKTLKLDETAAASDDDDDDGNETSGNDTFEDALSGPIESPERNAKLPDVAGPKRGNYHVGKSISKYYWDVQDQVITKEMMVYTFQRKLLTMFQNLPLVCRVCLKQGHSKNNCPEDRLPDIISLPKMSQKFMLYLSKACAEIIRAHQLTEFVINENTKATALLLESIQDIYSDAELELFGSFCNGFGFVNSDLDLCLTFRNNKSGEGLNPVEIIETLSKKLKTIPYLSDVLPITTAKVPIVKFINRQGEIARECDISLYNTLAQRNTKMLQAYCSIDSRVQVIGYVIKYFAKVLDICDASRGSLSSYAYILMAIYYLQQRNPPVIPVLQELYTGEKPVVMVENSNVWFFDDLPRLKDVWPGLHRNKESVAELWIGLLNFYAAEFDWNQFIVSIKQKRPLTKFSKMWNSKKLTIEDPFELNHNLGAGLSTRMSTYIIRSFIYAREHFGMPISHSNHVISDMDLVDYFFDRRTLSRGFAPPIDKGCRCCGKIGHIWKNCPKFTKKERKFIKTGVRPKRWEREREKVQMQQQLDPPRNWREVRQMKRNPHEKPLNMERHQEQRPRYQQQPPPGYGAQLPSMGLNRNPMLFPPPRPLTSSPFPSNAGKVMPSPLQPPIRPMLSNNQKLWPNNQRADNFMRNNSQRPENYLPANNPNIHWNQSRPQFNHGLDQSRLGAGAMMHAQGIRYSPGHSPANQERPRTNSKSNSYSHHKWRQD